MANNYKKVMTTVTSTGDATIYTVPAETTTLVKTAWAYNNSGGDGGGGTLWGNPRAKKSGRLDNTERGHRGKCRRTRPWKPGPYCSGGYVFFIKEKQEPL